MKRVTCIVPDALRIPAAHVMALFPKTQTLGTYPTATHERDGATFAVSSGLWTPAQIAGVQDPDIVAKLTAAGLLPEIVDVAQVAIAQAAFVLDPESFDPVKICAYQTDTAKQARDLLTDLGVVAVVGDL